MTDKLKVGVIGCGTMCRLHVHGYLRCGRYEIVALGDLSEGAMADFDGVFGGEEDYHPRHYTDAREMLDTEDLDVVSVGTWHRGHSTWTVAAAARKPKAVLCEKPMADSLGHASDMLVACRRNGVKLVIGHQRRFLPSYTLAREMIADGAIGEVRLITSVSGAGLPNWASHQMDMYRYLLGDDDCEWVMGQVERLSDQYERDTRIEDRAVGVFGFKGGARAMILSDLTPDYYQGAIIYGTNGMMELDTNDLRVMAGSTGGKWEHHRPDGRFLKYDAERFEWLEAGAGQADELADWIEGKVESHRGEGSNGYKALEMCHAVYESARTRERVVLPVRTLVNPLDLMVESGQLPVRYPGRYDIRSFLLRGENLASDAENS